MNFKRNLFADSSHRFSVFFLFSGIVLMSFSVMAIYDGGHAAIGVRLSNDMIENCVARAKNSQILTCIGSFSKPCRARTENSHPETQEECLEHEFVIWDQLMRKTLKKFKQNISSEQKRLQVQKVQVLWKSYHEMECRLPYSLLPRSFAAKEFGLNCSIQLTARRVVDLIRLQQAYRENL